MTKKQSENLPVLPTKTFVIPVDENLPALSNAAVDLLDKTDTEGYEEARDTLPYVSIRQKPLMDDKGDILIKAGSFRMQLKGLPDITDVSGNKGLVITVLADQQSRVFWANLEDDHPACKSNDALIGLGAPGGVCSTCPLSQWAANGDRPECALQFKVLCMDHNNEGLFYILNIGRSGLRPYNEFKSQLKHNKIIVGSKKYSVPPHFMRVRITSEYQRDPQPHYTPVFTVDSQLDPEQIINAKTTRTGFADMFKKTVATVDTADDDFHGNATGVADPGGELPKGVAAVGSQSSGDDDLPF